MTRNTRTLKEPLSEWIINICASFFPKMTNTFKLHSCFIQLLVTFHGLHVEVTHRHLKEFHVVYFNMKPEGVENELIILHTFPFSLHGVFQDWFYDLPHDSITLGCYATCFS